MTHRAFPVDAERDDRRRPALPGVLGLGSKPGRGHRSRPCRAGLGWLAIPVPDGWRVVGVTLEDGGTLSVGLTGDSNCGNGLDDTTIRLTPAGELVGDPPPTPLNMVYKALRIEPLSTTTGSTTFAPGAAIGFESSLVNRSSASVTLPLVAFGDESLYAAGTWQTWIERLGQDKDTDCLPRAGRKGTWYATGGWVNATTLPTTIPPGGSMELLFESSLWPDLTRCLPPGDYRYHVEYKPIGGGKRDVIDKASIDLTITGSPTSTPSPAPVPTPPPTPRVTPQPTPTPTLPPPSPAP